MKFGTLVIALAFGSAVNAFAPQQGSAPARATELSAKRGGKAKKQTFTAKDELVALAEVSRTLQATTGRSVGSDDGGVRGFVRDDQVFRRACDDVDADTAEQLPLGFGHEAVTGADDHIGGTSRADAAGEGGV